MPGNFGVRILEQMPTNLSDIWRERKTVSLGTQIFLEDHFVLPEPLEGAKEVDYPTDEDSDGETKGFSMKIPDITELLNEFEKDDEVIAK